MEAAVLMQGVTVTHVRFACQALEYTSFGAQPGSALRGGLYAALSEQFCPDTGMRHMAGHTSACPVCWLLANKDPLNERGQDLPRPLAVQPPEGAALIKAGEEWCFSLAFIGERAAASLPFLIRAVKALGKTGVGQGRGRFHLVDVWETNPFTADLHVLIKEGRLQPFRQPVTAQQIAEHARRLDPERLTLRFLTPLRIGEAGHLAHQPDLGMLVRRVLDRCEAMALHYGQPNPAAGQHITWKALSQSLSETAAAATLVEDATQWLEVRSGSQRTGKTTPIGGLVGQAAWQGPLGPLLPWLLWGQCLQVGKGTVKGNGWFAVAEG